MQKAALDTEEAVRAYKDLGHVEQAFRSYKTVDLKVRPIYHYLVDRVRAHVFLCMLAYYAEWHMRQALAPLLFDDDDKATAEAQRDSPVVPAKPSPSAQEKARTLRTEDDFPVHSFQTMLADLATIAKNRIRPKLPGADSFDQITRGVARLNEQAQRRFGVGISVRVGVHRGLVYLDTGHGDVYGLAVNVTARVSGLAPAGSVVV